MFRWNALMQMMYICQLVHMIHARKIQTRNTFWGELESSEPTSELHWDDDKNITDTSYTCDPEEDGVDCSKGNNQRNPIKVMIDTNSKHLSGQNIEKSNVKFASDDFVNHDNERKMKHFMSDEHDPKNNLSNEVSSKKSVKTTNPEDNNMEHEGDGFQTGNMVLRKARPNVFAIEKNMILSGGRIEHRKSDDTSNDNLYVDGYDLNLKNKEAFNKNKDYKISSEENLEASPISHVLSNKKVAARNEDSKIKKFNSQQQFNHLSKPLAYVFMNPESVSQIEQYSDVSDLMVLKGDQKPNFKGYFPINDIGHQMGPSNIKKEKDVLVKNIDASLFKVDIRSNKKQEKGILLEGQSEPIMTDVDAADEKFGGKINLVFRLSNAIYCFLCEEN